MLIRAAQAADAPHLVRFINMAADDLPLHFWQKSVGPQGDPWAYGQERAARDTGNFSYRNAWLAEVDGQVAACLLGYPADPAPTAIDPDTPAIFVPLLELEAMAPQSWYLNVLATYDGFRGKGCGSALLAHAETALWPGAGAQAAADDVEQVAAVAQGERQQLGEVVRDHAVDGVLLVSGEVFQPLGDGADALGGVFVEDVEGRLGVDEQGGGGAVDAGDGLVAMHG